MSIEAFVYFSLIRQKIMLFCKKISKKMGVINWLNRKSKSFSINNNYCLCSFHRKFLFVIKSLLAYIFVNYFHLIVFMQIIVFIVTLNQNSD
jgi:hypothetical protein